MQEKDFETAVEQPAAPQVLGVPDDEEPAAVEAAGEESELDSAVPVAAPVLSLEEQIAELQAENARLMGLVVSAEQAQETGGPEGLDDVDINAWSPGPGNTSYLRVNDSNFDDGSKWEDHLIPEPPAAPVHRVQHRPLPDGRIVIRPASFMGDDYIVESLKEIRTP